ncbi:hypothetical protein C8R44DRAFT_744455 [Mycena epipterygia]|nr:hypothetical protein C8R44DRAFT_744455 [Mycena epipterygia]
MQPGTDVISTECSNRESKKQQPKFTVACMEAEIRRCTKSGFFKWRASVIRSHAEWQGADTAERKVCAEPSGGAADPNCTVGRKLRPIMKSAKTVSRRKLTRNILHANLQYSAASCSELSYSEFNFLSATQYQENPTRQMRPEWVKAYIGSENRPPVSDLKEINVIAEKACAAHRSYEYFEMASSHSYNQIKDIFQEREQMPYLLRVLPLVQSNRHIWLPAIDFGGVHSPDTCPATRTFHHTGFIVQSYFTL